MQQMYLYTKFGLPRTRGKENCIGVVLLFYVGQRSTHTIITLPFWDRLDSYIAVNSKTIKKTVVTSSRYPLAYSRVNLYVRHT